MKKNLVKRFFTILTVLSLSAVIFSGCGASSESDTSSSDTFEVAYISSCPFEDGGWGTSCYSGFTESAKEFNTIKTYEVENVALENMESTIRQYCEAGVDLIISPDYDLTDAISIVAPSYPNVRFAVIDGTYVADNAMCMSQDNAQIGFIAGVIAAMQSETGSIGFVGGEKTDEILKASIAMEAGAKYINPDIEFTSVMSGSWTDVALGKEIGLTMVSSNNVDVIFSFASGVDSGVREACVAEDIYFIAQPSEAMSEAPDNTITSIIQSNQMLIYKAMKTVYDGTFEGAFTISGFEEGGSCSLGEFNAIFDEDQQMQVNDIIEKVLSGEIDVYSYLD